MKPAFDGLARDHLHRRGVEIGADTVLADVTLRTAAASGAR